MNDLLGGIVILIFGNVGLLAYFVVLRVLFPSRIARTQTVADLMPGRSFAVGLVNFGFFGGIALGFLALGDRVGEVLRFPGLLVAGFVGVGVSMGLTGVAQLVAERLMPQAAELPRTIWGALALSLACELPFFGWFLLLPYAALLGLGAFIIGFFYRDRPGPSELTDPA